MDSRTGQQRVDEMTGEAKTPTPAWSISDCQFCRREEWEKEIDHSKVKLPIAVHSNYLDIRIHSQKSCFTIHGTENKDFESLLQHAPYASKGFLVKCIIPAKRAEALLDELTRMGVTHTTVFPDLEHLGKELKRRFAVRG